mmetsp:Transcript_18700/g.17815  ORF Transcript_18700/g.17815 Transcript_18700/m.17815 type:complete len:156 (+) Transcript_18700:12-479(+)|eukprot:CAMPEP_0170556424 /NCGR_PEP_ID=MMETSP0211-20121228/16812_1 /TAXON_ID=311385 /ORGANISM="Pseudokeronopsis sp., Strain OXSARD2" /LENGTH=155 /DNA_ID=CAMNT_0010866753 /DNA_START=6 /DNA_END=473 /DNA_ORIENTATION=+
MESKGKEIKFEAKNPVHQMKIFEEFVYKESKFSNRNRTDEYTINPFTMQNITDKPNYITPKHPFKEVKADNLNDDVVDRAFRLDAMRRKIQSAGLQPRQKYPHSITASQDIGWYTNPLVPKNKNWQYNRQKTHITDFANEYFSMKKVNPFTVKER